MYFGIGALIVVLILVAYSLRVLREYERGVIFQLGRFWLVKGPGLIVLIPVVQQMVRVDLRTVVLDVPPQDVITRDNVTVKVNAVVYFRVIDPQKAIIQVVDFLNARGGANPNLSTLIKPLNLTPEKDADFLAFLQAMTGKPIPFQFPKLLKNQLNPFETTGLIQSVGCVGFVSA